jgi:hypothetical protein
VMPERISAVLSFSNVAKMEAWASRSPIGAEPGFQSEAIANAAP